MYEADAFTKIRDARSAAHRIGAPGRSITDQRNDFFLAVGAIRTAFERLKNDALVTSRGREDAKELKALVRTWHAEQTRKIQEDELMKWVFDTRGDDHHIRQGDDPLILLGHFATGRLKISGMPDDAVYAITGAGEHVRVIDYATTREALIPIEAPRHHEDSRRWALRQPPSTHLGAPLERRTPRDVLLRAADYMSARLDEISEILRGDGG